MKRITTTAAAAEMTPAFTNFLFILLFVFSVKSASPKFVSSASSKAAVSSFSNRYSAIASCLSISYSICFCCCSGSSFFLYNSISSLYFITVLLEIFFQFLFCSVAQYSGIVIGQSQKFCCRFECETAEILQLQYFASAQLKP